MVPPLVPSRGGFSHSHTYLLLTPLSRCCIDSRAIFKPSRRPGYPLDPEAPSRLLPPPKPGFPIPVFLFLRSRIPSTMYFREVGGCIADTDLVHLPTRRAY